MLALLLLAACTDPPAPPFVAVEAVNDPALVTRAVVEIALRDPVPVGLACTSPDDPDELHVLDAPPATSVQLAVDGLLASTTYHCTVAAGSASTTLELRTGALPDWIPGWDLARTGTGLGGYTLLNHARPDREDNEQKLLIVDEAGRVRWYWRLGVSVPDLDAQYLGDGLLLVGGGFAVPPSLLDLSGAILKEAAPSSTGGDYHHHAERIATGEVLSLATATDTDGVDTWTGFSVELLDPDLSRQTWTWRSQQAVDQGALQLPAPAQEDAWHANSVQIDDEVAWVNLRETSVVIQVDRATGLVDWVLGPDGDFELIDADGAPADPADWFYSPHAPEHEGDRILFYDNGYRRPGGGSSRVVELEIDEQARTARVLWEWTEEGWYEPIWGDVDRLADGHVLVDRAHWIHGADQTQRTEIIELDATHEPVWRLTFHEAADASYRAARIDGCAIFANAAACPDLGR